MVHRSCVAWISVWAQPTQARNLRHGGWGASQTTYILELGLLSTVPYGKFRKFPQAEQRAEGAFLVATSGAFIDTIPPAGNINAHSEF